MGYFNTTAQILPSSLFKVLVIFILGFSLLSTAVLPDLLSSKLYKASTSEPGRLER